MPLYEYRCESCRHLFEAYKRLSEEGGKEKCPACGGRAARVEVSLVGSSGSASSPSRGGKCGGGPRRSPFS
jgi:putative FmdB family regulatory protein